jgi:hypothetical protein
LFKAPALVLEFGDGLLGVVGRVDVTLELGCIEKSFWSHVLCHVRIFPLYPLIVDSSCKSWLCDESVFFFCLFSLLNSKKLPFLVLKSLKTLLLRPNCVQKERESQLIRVKVDWK